MIRPPGSDVVVPWTFVSVHGCSGIPASRGEQGPALSFGVVDAFDESSMLTGVRIVLVLADGSDPDAAELWARSVWPVTVEVECRLPAPMAHRLRSWDAGDGTGLTALATLLR